MSEWKVSQDKLLKSPTSDLSIWVYGAPLVIVLKLHPYSNGPERREFCVTIGSDLSEALNYADQFIENYLTLCVDLNNRERAINEKIRELTQEKREIEAEKISRRISWALGLEDLK